MARVRNAAGVIVNIPAEKAKRLGYAPVQKAETKPRAPRKKSEDNS